MTDKVSVSRELLTTLTDLASEHGYPIAGDGYDLLRVIDNSETEVPFDQILEACHLVHEMYRIKDRLGNGCNRVFENKETGQSVSVSFYRMNDINGNDDFAKVKYGEFEINYKAGMVRLSNYKLMASYFAYHLGKSE